MPPTPDPNTPAQPSQGFGSIFKNKILPLIGPIASRIGAAYGNPMGLEEEYRQQAARGEQLRQTAEQQAIEEEPLRRTILQNQARLSDPEYQLQQFRKQMSIERELTPTTGIAGGNLVMGSMTPSEGGVGMDFVPSRIREANVAAGTNRGGVVPDMSTFGLPQTETPFNPSTIGKLPPFASADNVPAPISGASTPTPSANPQYVGAPYRGMKGNTVYDEKTDKWVTEMINPLTAQIMGTYPAMAPAGALPPKSLIPYLLQEKNAQTATQEDWAEAAQTFNTRVSEQDRVKTISGPNGETYVMPIRESNTTSRSAPLSLNRAPAPTGATIPNGVNRPTQSILPKSGAGVGKLTQIFGAGKIPTDVTKANEDLQTAVARQTTMHKNLVDFISSGGSNQQAGLSLLANHLGMTQGFQKGARITQAVMEEATASRPWLEGMLTKIFRRDPQTGDYVVDNPNPLGGIVLTPDQARQMVDLADQMVGTKNQFLENMIQSRQALAKKTLGGPGQPPAPTQNANQPLAPVGNTPKERLYNSFGLKPPSK